MEQDDNTATSLYKGEDTIAAAVIKYAEAMNIRKVDINGYPTQEYDLEDAKQQLKKRWEEEPDASLEELITGGQKQRGPQNNRRY